MIDKTEQEIMQNWKGDFGKPTVSICTITYNHEQFIGEALDGFLMQETDFPFEVIIDDDCSTDNNAKIIQNYIDKYPNIFNANLRDMNVGMRINGQENLERAIGEYIALCEGDDYWTDKNKLQIQIDTLKKHKEIDICLHKAMKINMQNKKDSVMGDYLDSNGIIPIEDILLKSKGQIPTASTVFRKNVIEDFVKFQRQRPWLTVGDIYIHFFGSKRGGAYFTNQTMSVYRHFAPGSWSSMQLNNNYKKKISNSNSAIKAYEELDTFENNHFTLAFNAANKKRALVIIKNPDVPWFAKISFILKHKKYFSLNEQIAYIGFALIPIDSFIPEDTYQYLKKLFRMPSYYQKK